MKFNQNFLCNLIENKVNFNILLEWIDNKKNITKLQNVR